MGGVRSGQRRIGTEGWRRPRCRLCSPAESSLRPLAALPTSRCCTKPPHSPTPRSGPARTRAQPSLCRTRHREPSRGHGRWHGRWHGCTHPEEPAAESPSGNPSWGRRIAYGWWPCRWRRGWECDAIAVARGRAERPCRAARRQGHGGERPGRRERGPSSRARAARAPAASRRSTPQPSSAEPVSRCCPRDFPRSGVGCSTKHRWRGLVGTRTAPSCPSRNGARHICSGRASVLPCLAQQPGSGTRGGRAG